jgi:two-component system, cell cycle sensor histidine kinase and response regulator CckA
MEEGRDSRPCRETVLVVEDMEIVRQLTCQLLIEKGYAALSAANGTDALATLEERHGAVDLLFTDVLLPGISGARLFEKVHDRFPGIKALFMSGYASDILGGEGGRAADACFIQKPFSANDLEIKVREALGR